MKTIFKLEYNSTWDNNNKPLQITEGTILYPLYVKWESEGKEHEFIRGDDDFISSIFVSQDFIIVRYAGDSSCHPHPNNLVLYNLKREEIRNIPPPKQISVKKRDLPITGIGNIETIDNVKYIAIAIGIGDSDMGYSETHYLNLETFEYHPTYYDIFETFGQYSKTPTIYEKYGR